MRLNKERSHHCVTRIEWLMFECKSAIGCRLLPLATTCFEFDPDIQEVCARRLLDECSCKRFIQQLFCVAELFLRHEVPGERLQFDQRLRTLIFPPFAPHSQPFAM